MNKHSKKSGSLVCFCYSPKGFSLFAGSATWLPFDKGTKPDEEWNNVAFEDTWWQIENFTAESFAKIAKINSRENLENELIVVLSFEFPFVFEPFTLPANSYLEK